VLPFAKFQSKLTLTGATNDNSELSVDYVQRVLIPQLSFFAESSCELQIINRAFPSLEVKPLGKVILTSNPVDRFRALQFTKPSPFKAISGQIISVNIPPAMAQRLLQRVRQNFSYVSDISLKFESKKQQSAPGFGCLLESQTLNEGRIAAELYSDGLQVDPEQMADYLSALFAEEIKNYGACDSLCQEVIAIACGIAQEDVSYIRFGKLNERVIGSLRVLKEIFGVEAQLEDFSIDGVMKGVNLIVRGAGVRNVSKRGW